jgi:hypothetical protein
MVSRLAANVILSPARPATFAERSAMINWSLLSNPANWLIVFLMLALGATGITIVHKSMSGRITDAG